MTRRLNTQELSNLEIRKENAFNRSGAAVRGLQQSTSLYNDGIDVTRLITSRYTKKAFDYGWNEAVNKNQGTDIKQKDPRKTVRRLTTAVGAITGLAVGLLLGFVAPVTAPITAAIVAGGLAIGTIGGAIDGYFENRTINGAMKSGHSNALYEIENVKRDSEILDLKQAFSKQQQMLLAQQHSTTNQQQPNNSFTSKEQIRPEQTQPVGRA